MNKTLNKAVTAVKREISKESGIKQSLASKRIRKVKATRINKAALILINRKPIALIETGKATQTRKGVRVGRKLHRGAFIATMPSGHKGVFNRSGKGARRGAIKTVKTGAHAGRTYRPELPIIERKVYIQTSSAEKVAGVTVSREFGIEWTRAANRELLKIK